MIADIADDEEEEEVDIEKEEEFDEDRVGGGEGTLREGVVV